jgi:dolichol kinase
MSQQFLPALIFLLIFCFLLIVTHSLYKFFKVPSDGSRKFLHVCGGALSLFFPLFLRSHWWVLILCILAFLLLLITYIKRWLLAVHQTSRVSFGSIIFPVSVYICFFIALKLGNDILFYLPISILIISDTAAEWGGKKWGRLSRSFFNNQKTVMGSLCFAVSSLIISVIWLAYVFHLPIAKSLMISLSIAIIVAIAELVSLRGFDNITVPISALVLLDLLLS